MESRLLESSSEGTDESVRASSLLTRIAAILNEHTEEITRRWVDELRQTSQTEVHNEMLSSEIVDGMKALLANIAGAIQAGEAVDEQNRADATAVEEQPLVRADAGEPASPQHLPEPVTVERRGAPRPDHHVIPLPVLRDRRGQTLGRALDHAVHIGKLRHRQGYDVQEVVQEYTRLRRRLWKTMRDHLRETDRPVVDLAMYLDRLVDELLLTTVNSYHRHAVEDLERRAIRDPLSGLYNHDYFVERLREEVRRALRHDRALTLVMIDLDNLKAVNDTYGHQAGDSVLRHLAKVMGEVGRESDLRCRYAGDEFMIIMPNTLKAEGLIAAERLRNELNKPLAIGSALALVGGNGLAARASETCISPSVSVGVASYPDDARTPELLIAQVDAALYRAKAAGRNRISI